MLNAAGSSPGRSPRSTSGPSCRQSVHARHSAVIKSAGAIWDGRDHEVSGGPFDHGDQVDAAVSADQQSGSGDALLRPRPLRTVHAAVHRTRLKQASRARGRSRCGTCRIGGSVPPLTMGVKETDSLIAR